ncbi:MAG: CcmD family protein [Chloroflexaceae bacterium]|nr:CcmD family protein [Chloroflexaceae bacterium]
MNVALEAGVAVYIALIVALAVWAGVFAYLWRLDAQSRELQRRLEQQPAPEISPPVSVSVRQQRPDLGEPRGAE